MYLIINKDPNKPTMFDQYEDGIWLDAMDLKQVKRIAYVENDICVALYLIDISHPEYYDKENKILNFKSIIYSKVFKDEILGENIHTLDYERIFLHYLH